MFLECVTVCVNFSDVLAHTLPLNKRHFDSMVVVRDEQDQATWNLCRHHHVTCVTTNAFYENEQAFNKGNGINVGLAALSSKGWLLHLDADIVLPPRFREIVERCSALDPTCIYGVDRMMCPSYEEWQRFTTDPVSQHTDEIFVVPKPWQVGERVAKLDGEGYVPIGFFQLWNPQTSNIFDYPTAHGSAGRTDMLHALRWPRGKRVLLPEVIGVHLQGELPAGKTNWRGRAMEHFGPAAVPRPPSTGYCP